MLCEKCGKAAATTHIRSVVNGVVREMNLCSDCAKESGYADFSHNSLGEMLVSMLSEAASGLPSHEYKRCEVCGATFSDIAKSGKAGCAQCYSTFKTELLPYLKRVHGSTHHEGSVPNKAPLMVVKTEETLDSLRLELNRLVAEELYEQAAVVRDKIRKLEGANRE